MLLPPGLKPDEILQDHSASSSARVLLETKARPILPLMSTCIKLFRKFASYFHFCGFVIFIRLVTFCQGFGKNIKSCTFLLLGQSTWHPHPEGKKFNLAYRCEKFKPRLAGFKAEAWGRASQPGSRAGRS